jgi:hypothetical protein
MLWRGFLLKKSKKLLDYAWSTRMNFPLVLCTGMLRSGSTWSFNVCRHMGRFVAQKTRTPIMSSYLTPEQTDQFFQINPFPLPGPTVIKAHAVGSKTLELIRTGQAKSICTFRDPRDCVASMLTFADEPYEVAVERVGSSLMAFQQLVQAGNTLFIRYEDMMSNPLEQIRTIDRYLGVSFDEQMLRRFDQLTSTAHSRDICRSLTTKRDDQVLHLLNHRVDPDTWLHHNHIQNGKSGRWKNELAPEKSARLTEVFWPWLKSMGYESASSAA